MQNLRSITLPNKTPWQHIFNFVYVVHESNVSTFTVMGTRTVLCNQRNMLAYNNCASLTHCKSHVTFYFLLAGLSNPCGIKGFSSNS